MSNTTNGGRSLLSQNEASTTAARRQNSSRTENRRFAPVPLPASERPHEAFRSHFIDNELLEIDRGYHSIPRQVDRSLYGGQELFGATKKQRVRVDRIMFLVARLEYYHNLGMVLKRAGVDSFRLKLDKDFPAVSGAGLPPYRQAKCIAKAMPLPANLTLLGY